MKRKIYNDLLNWKENSIDTPLMIIGARQIGKTYVIPAGEKWNAEFTLTVIYLSSQFLQKKNSKKCNGF